MKMKKIWNRWTGDFIIKFFVINFIYIMAQKGKQANQNQDGLSKELEEQKKQLM